jgi:hypothetical protein
VSDHLWSYEGRGSGCFGSGTSLTPGLLRGETLWLAQKALAELFGVKRPAVTKHLGNIFATGELAEEAVCSISGRPKP